MTDITQTIPQCLETLQLIVGEEATARIATREGREPKTPLPALQVRRDAVLTALRTQAAELVAEDRAPIQAELTAAVQVQSQAILALEADQQKLGKGKERSARIVEHKARRRALFDAMHAVRGVPHDSR